MKFSIDETEATPPLAVCGECDWRGMADSRIAALKRLAIHEEFVHPETRNARSAYYNATYRRRVAARKKPGQPPKKGRGPKNRAS